MRDSNFKVLIKLASVLAVPLIVIYIAMIVFTSCPSSKQMGLLSVFH